MKSFLLACLSIALTGCFNAIYPDTAELEYKVGDVYRVKRPLFVENTNTLVFKSKPYFALTEPRERHGELERYLKNPGHESHERIRGIVRPDSRLSISRIGTVYSGRGVKQWAVSAKFLQPPLEGEVVSLYLVSGDDQRVGRTSSGCVDRRLLELVGRTSTDAEDALGANP